MAIIKCKMCGGDLKAEDGSNVCECEFCGTRQTVPTADNEKKMTLFTRASRLLRNCEFDKASGVFETIVADFPEEAEAYWGLVLCKYGIEYVDDPATRKKVPTCHRSSFDSVEDDTNFEQACENADAIARRIYREEARQIETLRKRILEVSGKEEPYDIFISYKELDENGERTVDSVIAQDIYKALDKEDYRVFFSRISLEGKLGIEYEPYIFAALNSAKVMIVVGTDYDHFDSVWVKNEWSRFLKLISDGQQKTIIPVYKDMDPYDMPKELRNLAAQNMGKIGAMQDLLHGIEKLIPRKRAAEKVTEKIVEKTVVQNESSVKAEAAIKRGKLALEDGEWDKAKQYFDQALTLDAECAEAYFGIALAELRAKDPESYIHMATSQIPKTEKLSIQENTAHIRKIAAENTVAGFLEESEITPLYRYDLSFSSYLKGQQEIQNQVRQQIEGNRSLSRALRFAAGEEKARMEGFKKSLYEKLQEKVDNARNKEEEYYNRTKQNYEKFLKETDQKVYELKQEACEKQTTVYQNAVRLQEKARTEADYRAAIKELKKTPGFQDSTDRIKSCENAITKIHDREALAQQTFTYQNAVSLQTKAKTVSDYQAAIEELKKNSGFQDSESRIKSCEMAIAEIHDRERREKEDQARKAAAKRKRTMATLAILAVLTVAAFFVVTKVVIPEQQRSAAYQEAAALYEKGDYDSAIIAFQSLGDYKDSVSRVAEVKTAKTEVAYQHAMTLYEQGRFNAATKAFRDLGTYKDSEDKVEEIQKAKLEAAYQEALRLYEQGKYDAAITSFSALGNYKNSEEKTAEVREAKMEAAYQRAAALYANEDFLAAYSVYTTLSGYKDVDTILETDENLLSAAAAVARKAMLAAYKTVGSTVSFGAYEQDNNAMNGKEPVEWIVLANEGSSSLLLSRYVLDVQRYNSSKEGISWETSSIRAWLNGSFMNTAFSQSEQNAILLRNVVNSGDGYNGDPDRKSKKGNDTKDKLFLLSYEELGEYFSDKKAFQAYPSEYAIGHGSKAIGSTESGYVDWWLRSVFDQNRAGAVLGASDYPSAMNADVATCGVRPAFWLNIESIKG